MKTRYDLNECDIIVTDLRKVNMSMMNSKGSKFIYIWEPGQV